MRLLVLTLLAIGTTVSACGSSPAASRDGAASRFLSRYVTSDGRVIRHDQGGDIVSEGQAYGMLIAEAAQQPALVRTIWTWTHAHLRQSDGLFAWHATSSGQILDPQSASDADVLIAYALLRYQGPDAASLHRAGHGVAEAVLANESVALPSGAPLIVAGPWARTAAPPVVNPSYLMPGVFDDMSRLTGDHRWSQAAGAAASLVAGLTDNGKQLPTDWAVLQGGKLVAAPQPGGGAPVQYGPDAERVPVWFATGCGSQTRTLAAAWWPAVKQAPLSPLALVAAAASAAAAGQTSASASLRKQAHALAQQTPTYYGDAWVALGPALLDRAIDQCGSHG